MTQRNLLIIGVSTIISLVCYSEATKNRYAGLFAEIMTVVQDNALIEKSDKVLFESAMDGMLTSIDRHSRYISGDAFKQFEEDIKQEFGGVGMYVDIDPETKQLRVASPIPDTPAANGGLRHGDLILEIDAKTTKGLKRNEAIKLIRGPLGETVKLKIRRPTNGKEFSTDLRRALIPVKSLRGDHRRLDGTWEYFTPQDDRIAYVHLTQFGNKTASELREALPEINRNAQGLILDLRYNAGGLLTSAVEVCDMLMASKGIIVETRGRGGRVIEQHFSTMNTLIDTTTPIVVLVDRNSASASEIVAACLQDHNRATVIGERSYGKGTVQNVIPIETGKSSIKLTVASYWSPNGRNIDRSSDISGNKEYGVTPNPGYQVELTEKQVFDVYLVRDKRQYRLLNFFNDNEESDPGINQEPETGDQNSGPKSTGDAKNKTNAKEPPMTTDPSFERAIQFLRQKLDIGIAA